MPIKKIVKTTKDDIASKIQKRDPNVNL